MKTLKLCLSLLGFAVLSFSCSTGKFLTSDVKPVEINDMLIVEPFSYISFIEKGNKSVYSDSISNCTKILLNKSLESYRGKLPLSQKELILTDSLVRKELEKEISYLILSAERNKNVKNISVTPLIDSLLTSNEKRFGLIIVQNGFTRDKGNYGGQIAKGIGMGILTLGMYYQTPIKASSTVYAVIVDSEKKNIAFYNKSVLTDMEPTKEDNITKQIQNVFEKYFWEN